MKKSMEVLKFESDAHEWAVAFKDYFHQVQAEDAGVKNISFSESKTRAEKEEILNKIFTDTLISKFGEGKAPTTKGEFLKFANNPLVKYFADNFASETIDMILPEALIASIGDFADIRYADIGETFVYEIENNWLYNVGLAGRRQRNVDAQSFKNTTVTLTPVNHEMTIITNLPDILMGHDNIGVQIMKCMRSIEAQIRYDAYSALVNALTASTVPSTLHYTTYSESTLMTLAETVTAWNNGKKAIIMGTPVALKSVVPSNTSGRYMFDSPYVTVGYIKDFNGYDVLPMSQVADYTSTTYGLKLDDSKIFVLSPASDKIIKVGIGGDTISHTSGDYDHANLSMFGTISKAWGVGCITNSVAGLISIS